MSNSVPEKVHAELGASSASRWMTCPGSVRLSRGIPNVETEYAREGTAAHALAELAISKKLAPSTWVGTTVEGVEVTDDMAEFVGVFVDYCNHLDAICDWVHVEQKFSLAQLNPPAPMFGTADFVGYNHRTKTLHVVDLKYGMGVVVEAKGNKQLRYYGLGAALASSNNPIDEVCLTIVQPRAAHPEGVVRSETIGILDLLAFAGELIDAARETLKPDAPLVPGAHCRFCPASGGCPAQLKQAQAIAQVEFDDLPLDRPPDPETLPAEVLSDLLGKVHILEDWAAALRARAMRELEAGNPVPGFKLVQKRATRKWANQTEAERRLQELGFGPEDYLEQKMKSPAQVEKLTGKKEFPQELVVKHSSGYTLAPEHDKREAVDLTPGAEFDALPGA